MPRKNRVSGRNGKPDSPKFDDIELSEEEKEDLRCLESNMILAQKRYRGKVIVLARKHGIDINDESKGRWNFDTDAMIFQKVG